MNSTAVLARTNLALRPVEQALSEGGIKYFLIGRSGFWASSEVRAVLAYLGCVLYPADWIISGAIHAPFWPSKFLPKTALLKEMKERKNDDLGYWKMLVEIPDSLVPHKNLSSLREFTSFIHSLSRYKNLPADEALKSVIQAVKAVEYYKEEESVDNDPVANLSELVKLASRYQTIKEFMDYTRRATAASKGRKGVAVSTIHGAKGLEFHTVYLIGCQEGLMPHSKSSDLEEERSIFFVGASRAERELKITYSGNPSPFLNQNSGIINSSTEASK